MRRRSGWALLLAAALLLSTAAGAAPFTDVAEGDPYAEAIGELARLSVLNGFEDGSYRPQSTYTREQFAKILYVLTHGEDSAPAPAADPFPDVVAGRWSAGYIGWARELEVVGGREDGLFHPTDSVTFAEAAKMFLVALGHSTAGYTFPDSYMDAAEQLGLFAGIDQVQANAPALRGPVAQMGYNALTAEAPRFDGSLLDSVFDGGAKPASVQPMLITGVDGRGGTHSLTALLGDGSTRNFTLDASITRVATDREVFFNGAWNGTAMVGRVFYYTLNAAGRIDSLQLMAEGLSDLEQCFDADAQDKLPTTEYSRISMVVKVGENLQKPTLQTRLDGDTLVFLRHGTPEAGYRYAVVAAEDLPMMVDNVGRMVAFGSVNGVAQVALAELKGLPGGASTRYGLITGVDKYTDASGKTYYGLHMAVDGVQEMLYTKPGGTEAGGLSDSYLMGGSLAAGYVRVTLQDDCAVSAVEKIAHSETAGGLRWVQGLVTRLPNSRTVEMGTDFAYSGDGVVLGSGFDAGKALHRLHEEADFYQLEGAPAEALSAPGYTEGDTVRLKDGLEAQPIAAESLIAPSGNLYYAADLLLLTTDDGEVVVAVFQYEQPVVSQ